MPDAIKDFLIGIASLFDFNDWANRDSDIARLQVDDYALMGNDWKMVGTDFWQAVDDHAEFRE